MMSVGTRNAFSMLWRLFKASSISSSTLALLLSFVAASSNEAVGGIIWPANSSYPYRQLPALDWYPNRQVPDALQTDAERLPSHLPKRSAIVRESALDEPNPPAQPDWWNQPLEREFHPSSTPLPSSEDLLPHKKKPWPWYDTPLGVLGIGVAATGVTLAFDHGINQYTETHISYNIRKHVALNFADVITDSAAILAGTTWFQSPWSSPKFAHTSSVALTAAAATTIEIFALKYAFGRTRPSGPNSNSLSFHPFSSRYTLFDTSFLFRGGTGSTSSFPSGHTAIAFALITPYAQNYHMPWLYTLPVLVGVSRIVAVNGHWASDVVAGGFLGWLTADLTNRLFPHSDYGFMIFGDGVGFYGKF